MLRWKFCLLRLPTFCAVWQVGLLPFIVCIFSPTIVNSFLNIIGMSRVNQLAMLFPLEMWRKSLSLTDNFTTTISILIIFNFLDDGNSKLMYYYHHWNYSPFEVNCWLILTLPRKKVFLMLNYKFTIGFWISQSIWLGSCSVVKLITVCGNRYSLC
jgi:hypothetical protein